MAVIEAQHTEVGEGELTLGVRVRGEEGAVKSLPLRGPRGVAESTRRIVEDGARNTREEIQPKYSDVDQGGDL